MNATPDTADSADFKPIYDRAQRYLKVAGVSRLLMGLLFSLIGLTAGIFIWGMTRNLAYGGGVAAIGMIAGFLSSRRGRQALNQGEPLMVDGIVSEKHVKTLSRRNEFYLVMQIKAVWRLHADGTRTPQTDMLGARTLTAVRPLFDGLQPEDRAVLACLPTGQAVFEIEDIARDG